MTEFGRQELAIPLYVVDKQIGKNVQNIGLGRAPQPVLETAKVFHFAKGSQFVPRHFRNHPSLDQEQQKKLRRSPNHLCIGLTTLRSGGPDKN